MAEIFGNQSKSYLFNLLKNALNSFKSIGYERITVDGTVKNLTIPAESKYALLVLESNGTGFVARCLQNLGTTVTTTTGMPISNGSVIDITDMQNLVGFQITEISSNTTYLHVEYYK